MSEVVPYGLYILDGVRQALLDLDQVPFLVVEPRNGRKLYLPETYRDGKGYKIPVGKDVEFTLDKEKGYVECSYQGDDLIIPIECVIHLTASNEVHKLSLKLEQWTKVLLGKDLSFYSLEKQKPNLTVVK